MNSLKTLGNKHPVMGGKVPEKLNSQLHCFKSPKTRNCGNSHMEILFIQHYQNLKKDNHKMVFKTICIVTFKF